MVEKRQMKTGVAYFETRNLRHVKEDLADMVAHNCTFVVHTMSEYDLNFNTLVMKDIVSLSHDMGLEVYINPWGSGRDLGGPETLSPWIAERPRPCRQIMGEEIHDKLVIPSDRHPFGGGGDHLYEALDGAH